MEQSVLQNQAQQTQGGQRPLSQTPRQPGGVTAAMDNTNKHFKGQQKDEVVLCFTRKHWVVLLGNIAVFLTAVCAIAGFFVFIPKDFLKALFTSATYRTLAFVAICILTYYLHRFFLRFFNYYLKTFIITNSRLLKLNQTIYLRNIRDSIDLNQIQDIEIHQEGLIRTLFNYGDLIITLSASTEAKRIRFVPNPEYFFKKINKTRAQNVKSNGSVYN